jgi:multidrug efflux pump subunit AcrA (membrane-fusion protein)
VTLTRLPGKALPTLAALLASLVPLGCQRARPSAEEKAPPATVKWQGASELSLEGWTELVGATTPLPDHVARVGSAVEARVRSVLRSADGKPVSEGQHVDKGTVLVQLDDTIARSNLARLEAAQEVLQEELQQSRLALELAAAEVDRLNKLKGRESSRLRGDAGAVALVSPVDEHKADIALRDARSKLVGSQAKLTAGSKDIDALKEQLRYYSVTAPISGRVGRIQVVPGQPLSPGTPIAEVINLEDEIDVLCFVPPDLVRHLQIGQTATTGPVERGPESPDPGAAGRVLYIGEQAEPETGNIAVKLRFTNKAAHLRANRVIRVGVLTTPAKECLALPEAAVSQDEEIPTVVVVEDIKTQKNDEGKDETVGVARRVQAELGVRDRRNHAVEIVRLTDPSTESGKKWHGDVKDAQFVVEGGTGLQTGDTVKLDVDED